VLAVAYFGRRYELGEVIGQGGFGVVYHAHDDHLGRDVALKLFRAAGAVHQAVYEARMLTALEGPHVLRVLNADIYQDVPFTATQIAPLKSAQDHVLNQGTSVPAAIRWTRHLLLGLDSCHRLNLIHRDVKPSNLFLQNEHLAQLGDFGVAHIANDAGVVPAHGDPLIRAPEMWTTNTGTARSDVFSAGVTLYYLLAGRYPVEGAPVEIAEAYTTGTYADGRDVAPHTPLGLAQRVRRAMAIDPGDRFASAEEMHTSLGQLTPMQREWKRVTTHDGHVECWEGIGVGGTSSLRTCVIPANHGEGFSIDTRRMTSTAPRVTAHCSTVRTRVQLLVALRRALT
jgi:eukaryotic-like serine/threonine-protein kinase